VLDGPLADKVANTPDEMQQGGIIFGSGFGVITDLQVGPDDGNLYVLTLHGSIFRISSSSSASSSSPTPPASDSTEQQQQ